MRIEFVKDHGIYRAGVECDHPHPGVAEVLISRGIARLVVASAGTPKPTNKPVKVKKPNGAAR